MGFKKTRKQLVGVILIIVLATVGLSCSGDDDNGDNNSNDTSLLYNKWWYDSDNFTADIYFNSNGDYEQRIELLGVIFTATGQWVWLDENNGIMKVNNLQGQGQVATEGWFKLTNIQATTLTVQQSLDGVSYSDDVFYQDTDPN